MSSFSNLMSRPDGIPFVLTSLAIVVGGVYAIIRSIMRHRERMAMIRMGMHPDSGNSVVQPAQDVKSKPTKEAAWSDWSAPGN